MALRSALSRALTLVACALTLAASGDDFNVVRVAFPAALPASEFPDDDPNTDFVRVTDCHSDRPTLEAAHRVNDLIAPGLALVPPPTACPGGPLFLLLAGHRHFPPDALTPLRC
jgi:hypothetical protein